jgi:pimeloyl-ACP methyl ester carboxylesterase
VSCSHDPEKLPDFSDKIMRKYPSAMCQEWRRLSRGGGAMSYTFVLVHGAWHGGWCWRRVADRLRASGHAVFTPTLTGLGERAHLAATPIGLATHIADVVNAIKWEGLADVVLCGHSYGGFIISGVADAMAGAIRALVFLDAFVPRDGESFQQLTGPAVQEAIRAAVARGDRAIAPRTAVAFGVNAADRAWVDRLCVPQPIATFTDTIALTGGRERIARRTYIRARSYANPGFDRAYDALRNDPSWRTHEVPCGHDVMVDMPDALAAMLEEAAR